ncbi:hypothetical protein E2C01_020758 [Portunus trituberculatus]|uniref:Uncharacterized protein n=1 Tax=Portunus trituberculatus TaxID=210409 RepID=A0A5B7E4C2_PORTR|nr:hypothetical protein [Portunus trituberculatus]
MTESIPHYRNFLHLLQQANPGQPYRGGTKPVLNNNTSSTLEQGWEEEKD